MTTTPMRWGACLAVAALASCARPAPPEATLRERKDGLGRALRLPPPERVRRIISLAPSSTEILFALGAGKAVVGVDRYSDWPPEARALPQVGADVDPSLERIMGLHPDLVLSATSANTRATAETLERLGIPVYVSKTDSLEEIYADILAVGELVGHAPEAGALVGRLRARVSAAAVRSDGGAAVKALVVVWPEPLMVAGRASHVGDLLRAAGGENIADESPLAFPTYSIERVLVRAPAVVIVGSHADRVPPLEALERIARLGGGPPRFRIVVIDGDLLFRPGPRVVDGIEALAKLLRPPAGGAASHDR